jgi:ATP-dependent Clp protease ATP-binding subunit ClpC
MGDQLPGRTVTITPRIRTTLLLADDIASRHGQAFIGTEHLLLALIEEGGGIAGQVLAAIGAADAARDRTEEILASEGYHAASPGVPPPHSLRLTVPPAEVLRSNA